MSTANHTTAITVLSKELGRHATGSDVYNSLRFSIDALACDDVVLDFEQYVVRGDGQQGPQPTGNYYRGKGRWTRHFREASIVVGWHAAQGMLTDAYANTTGLEQGEIRIDPVG